MANHILQNASEAVTYEYYLLGQRYLIHMGEFKKKQINIVTN